MLFVRTLFRNGFGFQLFQRVDASDWLNQVARGATINRCFYKKIWPRFRLEEVGRYEVFVSLTEASRALSHL